MSGADEKKNLNQLLEATLLGSDGTFAQDDVTAKLLERFVAYNTSSSEDPKICQSNVESVCESRDALDADWMIPKATYRSGHASQLTA